MKIKTQIDPEKDYFLGEVFKMGIIKNTKGKVAVAFSTCREVVNSNPQLFPSLKKVGNFYRINGKDLLNYVTGQK